VLGQRVRSEKEAASPNLGRAAFAKRSRRRRGRKALVAKEHVVIHEGQEPEEEMQRFLHMHHFFQELTGVSLLASSSRAVFFTYCLLHVLSSSHAVFFTYCLLHMLSSSSAYNSASYP
jgi:hypothetical protein